MGKNEESEGNEGDSEPVQEEGSFLTRAEAAKRIGVSPSKLRVLEATGRIPKAALRPGEHVPVFPEAVIDAYCAEHGETTPENTLGDLLRAARDLLNQEQTHGQRMFDKFMGANDKILNTLSDNLEKQHAHIMALEKQAFDMREAADKVLNYEHERKMAEIRESRKEAMQAQAIKSIMGFAGPFFSKKLGIELPGAPSGAAESQEQLLGQAVVGMLLNMSDEKFATLRDIVGDEAHSILTGVRMQAKGVQ
jgi:ribosomal protein L17